MASNSNKTPPLLSKAKTYNDWIKLLDIWTEFTELPKKGQGPAVLFSLEDKAQQGVLETLSKEEILTETDVAKIRSELDKIYKKDETTEKYFTPTSKAKKERHPNNRRLVRFKSSQQGYNKSSSRNWHSD